MAKHRDAQRPVLNGDNLQTVVDPDTGDPLGRYWSQYNPIFGEHEWHTLPPARHRLNGTPDRQGTRV